MRKFKIDGFDYHAKEVRLGKRLEIHVEASNAAAAVPTEDVTVLVLDSLIQPAPGLLQAGAVVHTLAGTQGYVEQLPGGAWILLRRPLMTRVVLGVTAEGDVLAGAELLCRYWVGDPSFVLPEQLRQVNAA